MHSPRPRLLAVVVLVLVGCVGVYDVWLDVTVAESFRGMLAVEGGLTGLATFAVLRSAPSRHEATAGAALVAVALLAGVLAPGTLLGALPIAPAAYAVLVALCAQALVPAWSRRPDAAADTVDTVGSSSP